MNFDPPTPKKKIRKQPSQTTAASPSTCSKQAGHELQLRCDGLQADCRVERPHWLLHVSLGPQPRTDKRQQPGCERGVARGTQTRRGRECKWTSHHHATV